MAPPSSNEQPGAFGALETREPLTDARIDAIARELLAQLSLEEKIDMMSGGHRFFPGMLHFGSAGYKRHPLTTVGAVPRLGIPGLRFTDGPRG
jgi:beta-glucosidase